MECGLIKITVWKQLLFYRKNKFRLFHKRRSLCEINCLFTVTSESLQKYIIQKSIFFKNIITAQAHIIILISVCDGVNERTAIQHECSILMMCTEPCSTEWRTSQVDFWFLQNFQLDQKSHHYIWRKKKLRHKSKMAQNNFGSFITSGSQLVMNEDPDLHWISSNTNLC